MSLLAWLFAHDCDKHGHYYEGRYDESLPPGFPANARLQSSGLIETVTQMIQAVKCHTYVKDVCRYCGDTIDREETDDDED